MKNFSKVEEWLEDEPDPAFARRARIIFDNLNLSGNKKVLDVGCGRGFYLKVLAFCWPGLDLYGLDLKQKYLETAKHFLGKTPVHLLNGDATAMPFPDNFFDRVIASEILEHLKDDNKAIEQIYRVLRPGGIALITVPNKNYPLLWDPANWLLEKLFKVHLPSNIWWLAGIWADHQRLYGKKEIEEKLKATGFKIYKTWLATCYCFPFSHFLLYGLGKNLVEKGFLSNFNRFSTETKPSRLRQIFLLPLKAIDRLNKAKDSHTSVNIIMKAKKTLTRLCKHNIALRKK